MRICKLIYRIDPVPKPRMTQRDKWAKRPCVLRYFEYKDFLVAHTPEYILTDLPEAFDLTFHIPMPKSWPQKKKDYMRGRHHQQRPDLDNLTKAFKDALYDNDAIVWREKAIKLWADEGMIEWFWLPVVGQDTIYEVES